jgi:hypothetical protein
MRETVQKIYTAISTDAGLMSYMKEFSMGGLREVTRLRFPFVNVGYIEDMPEAQTIGPNSRGDLSVFSISITFGTKSTIPEMAYYGDDVNSIKGILHMCDDLRTLCINNFFDGAFSQPSRVRSVRTDYLKSSADWVWVGEMIVEGRRKQLRTVRC